MERRMWGSLLVAALVAAWLPSWGVAQEKTWRAGTGRVVITPDQPQWMSGYASRTKPAEGKLHDLWCKALVLEDAGGKRGVLVTLDLVGIDRDLSLEICGALQRKYRLPRSAIILSTSHTHTGPVIGRNLRAMYFFDEENRKKVHAYTAALPGKVLQAVEQAMQDLQPAAVSQGIGEATFAVNRRTNKEADVEKLRAADLLKGPVDHAVPVLAVRRGNRLLAVAFGYACHATVLSFYQWSGDYPGFAMLHLEKRYPGTTALFWAGCAGDQNPLPRRKVELADAYGRQLAEAVQKVLEGNPRPVAPELATAYAEIPLAFDALPTREFLAKDSLSDNKYIASRARMWLERMNKGDKLPETYPYPIQAWRLGGDTTWVTLGGEVTVEYALRLQKEIAPGKTWVMAYANDVMAYIPSLKVLREGGYEGGGAMIYYGLPAVWSPRVEEHIVTETRKLVQGLQ